MEQSPSWQANSFSDNKKKSAKFYGIQIFVTVFRKNPPVFPILSRISPVQAFSSYFRKIDINVILPFMAVSVSVLSYAC